MEAWVAIGVSFGGTLLTCGIVIWRSGVSTGRITAEIVNLKSEIAWQNGIDQKLWVAVHEKVEVADCQDIRDRQSRDIPP